jgi:hypothetical protein
MGNNLKNKRMSARRAAGFLAALGVLVMSSGVAMMVAATPANAADPVSVTFCHSTSSESNPWELITTNANAFYEGHVLQQHTDDVYPSVDFTHGQDAIHVNAQGDQAFLANGCSAVAPAVATASATPIQPTCANPAGGYTTNVSNATFASTPAAVPGGTIHLTANATGNAKFAGGATSLDVPVTLNAAPTNCNTVVSPPQVNNPKTPKAPKHHTTTAVTPTVVHAGLAGSTVQDVRGEQGLALMVAGMVMLAGAGGLRLRSGRTSRI